MKFLRIAGVALVSAMLSTAAQAQDVYICETVCFCNDNGACACIEICDIVEEFSDELTGNPLKIGGFDGGALRISGFPSGMNGRTISIPKGTAFTAAPKGGALERLIGQTVAAGDYKVDGGSVTLKIDR